MAGCASGRYAERSPLNRDGFCGDVIHRYAWLGKALGEIISNHQWFFLLMSGGWVRGVRESKWVVGGASLD